MELLRRAMPPQHRIPVENSLARIFSAEIEANLRVKMRKFSQGSVKEHFKEVLRSVQQELLRTV
jgi:hypothetical protein